MMTAMGHPEAALLTPLPTALSCLDVRPLIKGYFSVALVVGALMSSTFGVEN